VTPRTDANLHPTDAYLHVRAWPGTVLGPYVTVAVAFACSTTTTYLSPADARSLAERLVRGADEAERLMQEGASHGMTIAPAEAT